MNVIFTKMTQAQAEEIAFNWHYKGAYSLYDMEADKEDLEEFINPEARGDSMFAVTREDEWIGFFGVYFDGAGVADIALGLRPDLTAGDKETSS